MSRYPMIDAGMFGEVAVPPAVFESLRPDLLTPYGSERVKYLCANAAERTYLESLGVVTSGVVCDWFRVVRRDV